MKILVVYETQTGTTKYVCELLQGHWEKAGHQVTLHSLKYDGIQPKLEGAEVVVFGSPTYDDGLLQKEVKEFVKQVTYDLSQHKVAVFGLGNRTYPQFCRAADLLEKWVAQNKGSLLLPSLRLDGFPDEVKVIEWWAGELGKKLSSNS